MATAASWCRYALPGSSRIPQRCFGLLRHLPAKGHEGCGCGSPLADGFLGLRGEFKQGRGLLSQDRKSEIRIGEIHVRVIGIHSHIVVHAGGGEVVDSPSYPSVFFYKTPLAIILECVLC